jgi:hypothetical protein
LRSDFEHITAKKEKGRTRASIQRENVIKARR